MGTHGYLAKPGANADGFAINQYFIDHPEMVLGRQTSESTQYGRQDFTVAPIEGADLAEQLSGAIRNIRGTYAEAELPDLGEDETIVETIPADPNVRNFSYTVVDGELYYRQNSIMTKPDFNATAKERAKGMVELRDCVQKLISQQMDGFISDDTIRQTQAELNTLYDGFTAKYGLINSRANALAFAERQLLLSALLSGGAGRGQKPQAQGRYVHQANHTGARGRDQRGYRFGGAGAVHLRKKPAWIWSICLSSPAEARTN